MTIESKIKLWAAVIIFMIILFLVSLSWNLFKDNIIQDKHIKELQRQLDNCQQDNANVVIEKEILYKTVKDLTYTVDSQTTMVKALTKQIKELKYSPVIVRAIPCDDVLNPFSGSDTSSRGF